jgi:Peptidase S24-like
VKFFVLKLISNIYLSHHASATPKAKELIKHLNQLSKTMDISVSGFCETSPGKNIEDYRFDEIQKAHVILILVSVDYINECNDELDWIKKSNCYQKSMVIPVPIENCFWKDTWLGKLMPLPIPTISTQNPFDNSGFYHDVSMGAKSILEKQSFVISRHNRPIAVRASSNQVESSQENDEEIEDISSNIRSSPGDFSFTVEGDSMWPTYINGDTLIANAFDIKENTPKLTQKFVIRTKNTDYVVKRIASFRKDYLILRSDNRKHKDFKVSIDEIISVFIVKTLIRKEPI